MVDDWVGAFDLRKFGPVGLLLILTVSLVIFTVPGAFGTVLGQTSPMQRLVTVKVTVLDCVGNPVLGAVIQAQSFTWGRWTYTTDPNGNAFISVPPGTYTLRGGYSTYFFNETISVGTVGYTATLSLGGGCSSFGIVSSFSFYYVGKVAR